MGITKAIEMLNTMQADGVIGRYAIAGAVAAYNYIEPTLTEDLDVLVAFTDASTDKMAGLVTLEPLFAFLAKRGYTEHVKEGIVIDGWQVQFLPAASELDLEALANTGIVELRADNGGLLAAPILKPEYLVANCLRAGRPKDLARMAQFLAERAVDISVLCAVLSRHDLNSAWQEFCAKMGIGNPCGRSDDP
jgi:hypothetical protein